MGKNIVGYLKNVSKCHPPFSHNLNFSKCQGEGKISKIFHTKLKFHQFKRTCNKLKKKKKLD
jgi:hypothetical protein